MTASRPRHRSSRTHGFTLVELLVGMAVFTIAGGGLYTFIRSWNELYVRNFALNDTEITVRAAVDRITREMESAAGPPRPCSTRRVTPSPSTTPPRAASPSAPSASASASTGKTPPAPPAPSPSGSCPPRSPARASFASTRTASARFHELHRPRPQPPHAAGHDGGHRRQPEI